MANDSAKRTVVLLEDGVEVERVSDGFLLAVDKSTNMTRLTLACNQLQLAEFLAQIMDEFYGTLVKDGKEDTVFLQAMATLANDVVRENRQEVQ